MPDAEGTRKRSRSPSDSDAQQQSSKRPNTGVEPPPRVKAEEDHVSTTAPPFSAGLPDPPSSAVVAASEQADSALTGGVGDTPVKPEPGAPAPMGNISMRCLIVTQDASIIIGKAGAHVNEIREKSNARVTVSESLPGNPERILNVTGPLDAVSKVSAHTRIFDDH
jgi:heterogeneous nuclear rnp K-like protein 2